MINAFDQKRSQENSLNRTNSIRRSNTITVAASSEDDEDENDGTNSQHRSLSSRCCGTG